MKSFIVFPFAKLKRKYENVLSLSLVTRKDEFAYALTQIMCSPVEKQIVISRMSSHIFHWSEIQRVKHCSTDWDIYSVFAYSKLTSIVIDFTYFLFLLLCQTARVHLLDTETFENTFGPKAKRKRPALATSDLEVYLISLPRIYFVICFIGTESEYQRI